MKFLITLLIVTIIQTAVYSQEIDYKKVLEIVYDKEFSAEEIASKKKILKEANLQRTAAEILELKKHIDDTLANHKKENPRMYKTAEELPDIYTEVLDKWELISLKEIQNEFTALYDYTMDQATKLHDKGTYIKQAIFRAEKSKDEYLTEGMKIYLENRIPLIEDIEQKFTLDSDIQSVSDAVGAYLEYHFNANWDSIGGIRAVLRDGTTLSYQIRHYGKIIDVGYRTEEMLSGDWEFLVIRNDVEDLAYDVSLNEYGIITKTWMGKFNDDEWNLNNKIAFYYNYNSNNDLDYKIKVVGQSKVWQKNYHSNGNTSVFLPFVNNKKDGLSKRYYETGELKQAIYYSKGVKIDSLTTYFKNGSKEQVLPFENDIRSGLSKWYYDTGELNATCKYVNDKLEETYTIYNKAGIITRTYFYKNDAKNGLTQGFYDSGQLKTSYNLINGKIDGVYMKYYENGQLKYLCEYEMGKIIKLKKTYNMNGKKVKKGKLKKGTGTRLLYSDETGEYVETVNYKDGVEVE